MLTNKITGFSADLLNTVRGILGEAKKRPADCECEKCEAEDEDEKEMKEGSMPTADEPTDANKKTADKVRALLAKEKKPVKEEAKEDLPFEGPYRKTGDRKDEYGNKVKNVAKHLAKKAMKANEEAEHNNCGTPECCGQCDTPGQIDETAKIVAHLQKRYGDNIRKSHVRSAANDFGVDASKLAKAVRTKLGKTSLAEEEQKSPAEHYKADLPNILKDIRGKKKGHSDLRREYGSSWKRLANSTADEHGHSYNRSHLLAVGKKHMDQHMQEEVQIDEVSKATLGRYINKAKDSIDTASYRQGHKEAHGSSSKPLEKKLTKRHKGISTAVGKLTKEESEQIDELSKGTMGRYINKAATKMGSQGVTAGLKIAADEKSSKNFKDMGKREKGIKLAVNKLTKEEQDFIDSLNDADIEQIDELSKDTMLKYLSANKKDDTKARETGDYDKMTKRMRGTDMAVRKYTARDNKYVRIPATEEVELDEARGRPRKAGAKDFTIHPKTKEKLMHNNPEHMKKIEVLQKNGILEKPKVEAGQHIMNQLRKAKTSMLGGSKINFTHGDSKEVSGTHAAKILTKYAGMKPDEKENFQKFVGHSHENLMKHV
jgi:hypothetical protein